MTDNKKKQLKNHLSEVRSFLNTFFSCMDVNVSKEEEDAYLLELITEMETLLQEGKNIINQSG